MAESSRCPRCGGELAAGTPQGLCPRCLLEQGIASNPAGSAPPPFAETTPHSGLGRFVAPTPAMLAPYFPQLEIVELLGVGGMGAVYKARQARLDRFVAIKILPNESARDPAFAERFAREAKALARLNHPHVVAIYDFGETAGLFYFVMEYVDGANLRQMLASGDLTPREAVAIVPQICDALQFAHDEGLVHRDIKPENILLDRRGNVKIADFGLAKLLDHAGHDSAITRTRQVMGTPQYIAPEQIETPQQVDHRADIYSLGVVFYEMLTGELPIGRFEPPSQRVQIDVRLDEVVLKSLEKRPERRYQQASEVKTDVESISSDRSPSVSPAARVPPAPVRVSSQSAEPFAARSGSNPVAAALPRVLTILLAMLGFALISLPWIDARGWQDSLAEGFVGLGFFALTLFTWVAGAASGIRPWRPAVTIVTTGLLMLLLAYSQGVFSAGVAKHVIDEQILMTFGICMALLVVGAWDLRNVLAGSDQEPSRPSAEALGLASNEPAEQTLDAAQRVRIPAIGLIVAGILDCALPPLIIVASIWVMVAARQAAQHTSSGETVSVSLAIFELAILCVLIPLGIVKIIGGVKLARLRSIGFVQTSAVLSLLPITPTLVLGLPAGIWALVATSKRDVADAFRANAYDATPAQRLAWPAIGLVLAAIIDFSAVIFFGSGELAKSPGFDRGIFLLLGLPALVLGVVRLAGGIVMLRMKEPQFAFVASIVSLLPVSWGAILGIPAGIWALFLLSKEEVKAAFEPTTHADFDDDEARLTEMAARPPAWIALAAIVGFTLSWLVVEVGTMAGGAGLLVAIALMAAITYGAIWGQLAYLPKLRAEIARQTRLARCARLAYGFVMLGLSVLLIVFAHQMFWSAWSEERMASLESAPALGASGEELRKAFPLDKLDSLRPQSGETLAVVEWGDKGGLSSRTRWINAALAEFLGLGLMLTAVQAGFDTRRYRNSWKYSIGPTLATVALWAAGLVLAGFVLLASSNTTWKMSPAEDAQAAATTAEVDELISDWARHNGYDLTVRRYWRLEQILVDAGGAHTTPFTVRMIELRPKSNWGSSWRIGRTPFVRETPLNVTQISLDERPESYMAIRADWYIADTPEETAWPATIERFKKAVGIGRTEAAE